jgi:hypothetical protein
MCKVESILGLACSLVFFLYNRCVISPPCPADSRMAGIAFTFYTTYVASGQLTVHAQKGFFSYRQWWAKLQL